MGKWLPVFCAPLWLATTGPTMLRYTFEQPTGCDVVFGWEVAIDGYDIGFLGTGICGPGDCGLSVIRTLPLSLAPGQHTTTVRAKYYPTGQAPGGETAPSNAITFTVP